MSDNGKMRYTEEKKEKNEGFKKSLKVFFIIIFCNFSLLIIEFCSGKEREQANVYSLISLFRFWSNYGFQISFGYIAFWSIIPTVSFNKEFVKKYYLKKRADFFIFSSIVYLLVSLFASLFYTEIIKNQDFLYFAVNNIVMKILVITITQILMFFTFIYVLEFAVMMKDFLKYVRMNTSDLCDEIASEKGLPNNERLKQTVSELEKNGWFFSN